MKSVLISIRPMWCERAACGEKTDELRKRSPKLPVPFKSYIYQTNSLWGYPILRKLGMFDLLNKLESGKGKVIGEFICDGIENIDLINEERISKTSCVSPIEMMKYARPKSVYDLKAWHISDLKIYEKPKELSEFYFPPEKFCEKGLCGGCPGDCVSSEYGDVMFDCEWKRPISRPPQSWCYVEELQ